MKKTFVKTLALLVLFVLGACSNKTQTSMMRNVSGKAGELIIVIAPELWNSGPGQALRDALAQPQAGLPQDEPLFTITNIPVEGYGDIFKTSRNIIEVNLNAGVEKPGINFKRNVHAYTQALVTINGNDKQELEQLIRDKSEKIIGFLFTAERERLTLNYEKYSDKAVRKQVEEKFGLIINVPPGFNVEKVSDDFMWVRYETEISQGILIYSYPYESDSTFTPDYLKTKRNLVLKNNVPGPRDGSFMSTDSELPIFFNTFKKDSNYAAEMRGLWRVEGDFMGGPFISLSILDLLRNRVITLDGYVYAPSRDKRNLLRQVEAMIYSSEFTDQADMNKLNKQFE